MHVGSEVEENFLWIDQVSFQDSLSEIGIWVDRLVLDFYLAVFGLNVINIHAVYMDLFEGANISL